MHISPGGASWQLPAQQLSSCPPPHRHDFEETFILLEGEMEATFRGKRPSVRAATR